MAYSSAVLIIYNEEPIHIPLLEPPFPEAQQIPPWARAECRACKTLKKTPCTDKNICMMLLHIRPLVEAFNNFRSIDTGRATLLGNNIEITVTSSAYHLFFTLFWQLVLNTNCEIFNKNLSVLGRQYSYSTDLNDIFYKFYSAHITRKAILLNDFISVQQVKEKIRERISELKCLTTALLDAVEYWEAQDVAKNALIFVINVFTLMLDDFDNLEKDFLKKLRER